MFLKLIGYKNTLINLTVGEQKNKYLSLSSYVCLSNTLASKMFLIKMLII